MLFLVTSNFRNSHQQLGDVITRTGDAPTHEDQYDAGEIISIGRDSSGRELTAEQIAKAKGPDMILIGHLNAAGRLLDPAKQQRESQEVYLQAAANCDKEAKALITARNFLDPDKEKPELETTDKKLSVLRNKSANFRKLGKEIMEPAGARSNVTKLNADGTPGKVNADGTITTVNADGSRTVRNANGTVRTA